VSAEAERILGWKASPDRFFKSGRSWIPKWRFQPLANLADAFELLDCAAHAYTLTSEGRIFTAEVRVGSLLGRASGQLKSEAITIAVARALGIDVEVKG
jgi:hypothetical protein